ncbi:hypothetical protein BOQ62_22435 [Chryseobacterium sp. CH21]|uniref:hypothetical protein n=1 Tax=Chryseobacterium sp. CH21 TaxID=713556 RepID=UPI00100C2496|nr:hypothetical protein [Chryseobacterium sp. CH21]RXM37543.1 hypothetical protein BOQ62_22435 [Chryseobacterium sp. CH21]
MSKEEQNSKQFQLYKEKIFRNNKEVGEVSLYKDGHLFMDKKPKPVYEPPHYHNKKGAHYTFKGQMPRSTNKTGKQH